MQTRLLSARHLLLRRSLNLQFRYHGTHDDADGAVVDLVYHVVEQLCTLQLEDEQGVLLFVAGIVYAVLQLIEQSQVLFPCIVDDVQDDGLVEGCYNRTRLALIGFLEVRRDVVLAVACKDRNHRFSYMLPCGLS